MQELKELLDEMLGATRGWRHAASDLGAAGAGRLTGGGRSGAGLT